MLKSISIHSNPNTICTRCNYLVDSPESYSSMGTAATTYLGCTYPGSCGGGEKRAWYRPFAHALNYKLKNHVYVANDV